VRKKIKGMKEYKITLERGNRKIEMDIIGKDLEDALSGLELTIQEKIRKSTMASTALEPLYYVELVTRYKRVLWEL
jgi:hypothetical protein